MAELTLANSVPILYEPKRENRWTLEFPNDVGLQTFMLKSFERPKTESNTTEIEFLNTSTYVGGRVKWSSMTLVIRDFIAPSSMQAVMSWFRQRHESVTGRQGYASGYLKNLVLNILDPTGVAIEKWSLRNCMLESFDGGTLDYSSDNLLEISITIQPQDCILLY